MFHVKHSIVGSWKPPETFHVKHTSFGSLVQAGSLGGGQVYQKV